MKMYIGKVGIQSEMEDGQSYKYWSDPHETRKDAKDWCEDIIFENSQHELPENRYDCCVVEEIEVNYTDNEEVAKREGYKPFWVNVYETAKHVKLYYAKDKESLETDLASEQMQEDWNENAYGEDEGWFWKNGQTDFEIFEDKTEEVI